MNAEEKLKKKLQRFERWASGCDRMLEKEGATIEQLFRESLADMEKQKQQMLETFSSKEIQIQNELDQAGKEYARKKYQLERDVTMNRAELARLDDDIQDYQKKSHQELNRLNEEKTQAKISYERQMNALRDLYQEKRRHLTVSKTKLLHEWETTDSKLKESHVRIQDNLTKLESEGQANVRHLTDQMLAKREGWKIALETMGKEREALNQEKSLLEKKISDIHGEKEKELEAARVAMILAKEQLEVDKATLIEKAEDEQRRCEEEVSEFKHKIEVAEKELQDLMVGQEQKKKDIEDGFLREENVLKDSLKTEAEKRDYEQKLFEQEKSQKEKEINNLREEYEKRKWHWDNQIRSLMMKKSVQDSEHEAVRMRVDREARTVLRSLEAKRDELKQRLADLKNRHKVVSENAQKETDLINQRWHWRRDRLWAMWQNRLDVLRKERGVLQEQMEMVQKRFEADRAVVSESENRENVRTNDLQGFLAQSSENNRGQQKQREIQFELEKTRVFTQIKECESLVTEWTDRLKEVEADVKKNNLGLIQQIGYLDRWYREEEVETQLFLQNLQSTMSSLEALLNQKISNKANAA